MKLAILLFVAVAIGVAAGYQLDRRDMRIARLISFEAGRNTGRAEILEKVYGTEFVIEWERKRGRALLEPFARHVGEAAD